MRLAIVVSHPIQYHAPWYRALTESKLLDVRVFFSCDWGIHDYLDPEFGIQVKWDIPLLEGYPHEFLGTRKRPKKLDFWEVDSPEIENALNKFDPHIVQVFGYAHRTNWRAARWGRKKGRPVLLYSDSHLLNRVPFWKSMIKRIVVRKFYSLTDGAFYVGDNNFNYHLHFGLPADRLFPGMIPIDCNRFQGCDRTKIDLRNHLRQRLHIPDKAFVLLLCGKYVARKRPLDLLRAIRSIDEHIPVWALLVGEGPERNLLDDYCREHELHNVVLTGFVNQSSMPEFYAASDALVITSSRDSHPLVVTEAGCFGLPIILSDRVGCIGKNDTARPGANAIVYGCGDIYGLSKAIERLYSNRELYASMAAASREIAARQDIRFAAKALAEATFKLHELGPR